MNVVVDLLNVSDGDIKKVLLKAVQNVASGAENVNLGNMKRQNIFEAVIVVVKKLLGPKISEVNSLSPDDFDQLSQSQTQTQDGKGEKDAEEDLEKQEGDGIQSGTQSQTDSQMKGEAKPCYFFRAGRCKFSNNTCKFEHGKICKKYKRHGRGDNGCKLGKECPKLHVILCPSSYRNKECEKGSQCTYKYHIKNPKFPNTCQKEEEKTSRPNPFLGQSETDQKICHLEGQIGELTNLMRTLMTSIFPFPMQQGAKNSLLNS